MTLRNLSLLFIFMILIGCNQSDSNTESNTQEQAGSETQTSGDANNAAEPEEKTGKIVARVNGNPIYEEDLMGKNLEYVVTEEIIYQVGLMQGADKEYEDRVKEHERTLIISGTKAKILADSEPEKKISDEEIQQYYDDNKDRYEFIRIQEISFPDAKMGDDIKARAEKGEDLQEIANSFSDVPVTVTDLGFNRAMEQKFNDSREIGNISDVVQKPNGTFSVLKIVEIRDVPLKISKRSIRNLLEANRKAQLYDDYAREAAKENNIEIEIID